MVSVIYRKRALPLAWIVVKGSKGHFPEEAHVELLKQVHILTPEHCQVIFLGDGEFDGIKLQATLEAFQWGCTRVVRPRMSNCAPMTNGSFLKIWASSVENASVYPTCCSRSKPTAQSWPLPLGTWNTKSRYISSRTWSWLMKPVTGTANGIELRPFPGHAGHT
jgi:hypothetical protein